MAKSALDLPSLPTESLYKFQAFAGLFLVFSTLVYVFKLIDAARTLLIELDVESQVLSAEIKAIHVPAREKMRRNSDEMKSQFETLTARVEEADNLLDEKKKSVYQGIKLDLDSLDSKLNDANSHLAQVSADNDSLEIKTIKSHGKLRLAEYQVQKIKILAVIGFIAIAIGLFLAVTGFKHWQVVQDDIDAAVHQQAQAK